MLSPYNVHKVLLNKKAASIILMIFELLVVILVVGMTFYAARNYAKSETIQKEIITEDLRMMVNTLVAVPGDAIVRYPQDTSLFTFILTSSEVIGYLKGQESQELGKVRRTLFLPLEDADATPPKRAYTASGTVEGEKSICLEKKNKHISLQPCPEVNITPPEPLEIAKTEETP
ncbi:hypothetical protein HYX13_02325 [Candidatus Woesearchaeota archaeon]|nr:hypothetical protein [Candidatus Woesearchaeota archaeon]